MQPGPKYAWYGDDFTGASDTLATVAGAGLRALLFLGVPAKRHLSAAGPLDALGIAGAARAMDPAAMREELAPVGRFLASLAAPVIHYKCCSTFDSAPGVGSLGVALETLRRERRGAFVPIVGGQPSLGRYCAFGQLFATAGGAGEAYRIDRHPTMSVHPVTPMHESDLRRHLGAQGLSGMALIDLRVLDGCDDAALDEAVDAALAADASAVLFDATGPAHLARIGRVLWERARREPLVALGASSVAQALIAHWRAAGELSSEHAASTIAPAGAPVFVLSGSQSPVTARQIELACGGGGGADAKAAFARVTVDAGALVGEPRALETAAQDCARWLERGRSVLAHPGAPRTGGPAVLDVAAAGGRLLARVLELAPFVRRAGVAGGDSSSLAVRSLGAWALGYAGSLSPGVALTRVRADAPRLDGLELMLKGGQMGPPDLFERLVSGTR